MPYRRAPMCAAWTAGKKGFLYDDVRQLHLTLHGSPRFDRTHTFILSVLNRAVTLLGFSTQLALIHDVRLTNAQARD